MVYQRIHDLLKEETDRIFGIKGLRRIIFGAGKVVGKKLEKYKSKHKKDFAKGYEIATGRRPITLKPKPKK